jgi:D-alanine-D-alanine ligase-like ATP-grasp enzyme
MHSKLTDRSVVVFKGGHHPKSRKGSMRSGASVYHGLRSDRDTYDIHIQADGNFNHKGKEISRQRIFQSHATLFNALHGKSAGRLARASQQYGAKHTGNSHMHQAEMRNHQSRRKIFQKHGIHTIPHWKYHQSDKPHEESVRQAIKQDISYPVVVTPLPKSFSQDSVVAHDRDELSAIISTIGNKQDRVYLQEGIEGNSFSGLVMPKFRQIKPYAFPPFERAHDRKFINSGGEGGTYQPENKLQQKIQDKLRSVFQAGNFACLTRIDIGLSRHGNWYLLDVETHPRLDRHSLLADSADRVGTLLKDVYHQQVELARKRRP